MWSGTRENESREWPSFELKAGVVGFVPAGGWLVTGVGGTRGLLGVGKGDSARRRIRGAW